MKKILCLFLLLIVILHFSACCSSEDSDENTTNNNTTEGDTTGDDTNSDELKLEGYVLSTITGSVDVESILTRSDIISRTDLIHLSDMIQTAGITSPVGVPVDTMKKKDFRYKYKNKSEISDDKKAVFVASHESYQGDYYPISYVSLHGNEFTLTIPNNVPLIISIGVSTCKDPLKCFVQLDRILISSDVNNYSPVTFTGASNNLELGKIEKNTISYITQTPEIELPEWLVFQDWVIKMALGNKHTCALLNTGSVKCWGTKNKFLFVIFNEVVSNV